MAIVGNALSEIGDIFVFSSQIPTIGLVSISGYAEDVDGLTATRFFDRQFRYSTDGGLNYSDYLPLSSANLQTLDVNPSWDIIFEYKYTRIGTDSSGVLLFNWVQIQGVYQAPSCGAAYISSVFSYFNSSCNSTNITGWALNVLKKVYEPGIVSISLTRGSEQNQNQQDRDYIDFWRTQTTYFSYLVNYARGFESFYDNRNLLIKYLRNRDVYVCQNQSLTDLQYITKNYYDEMRHRGTLMIAKAKGYELGNGNLKQVDGELLRLLCYNPLIHEFLFAVQEFDTAGWIIDRWSPLWRGVSHQLQVNKAYEHSLSIIDLSNYPIENPSKCSVVTDGDFDVLSITNVDDQDIAGIALLDDSYAVTVDNSLSYELSFYIKQQDINAPFSVAVDAYDGAGNSVFLEEMLTGTFNNSNELIVKQTVVQGQYIWVRCIIHAENTSYVNDINIHTPNILTGQNLRLTSAVNKIMPKVYLDNDTGSSSGEIRLYGIRLAPLSTPYSKGFLGVANLIETWQQTSSQYSSQQIESIMSNKLLPLGSAVVNNYL